jgi:hypothetical protein
MIAEREMRRAEAAIARVEALCDTFHDYLESGVAEKVRAALRGDQ